MILDRPAPGKHLIRGYPVGPQPGPSCAAHLDESSTKGTSERYGTASNPWPVRTFSRPQ